MDVFIHAAATRPPHYISSTRAFLRQENFVTFLPNYLRLSLAVLLLTFYLRPRALLGAAAVGYSTYRALTRAYRQHVQRQQQQQRQHQRQRQQQQRGQQEGGAVAAVSVDSGSDQIVSGLTTVATWVLVAYTRCMPILLLGSLLALLATLLHTALRQAPSEHRHSGRQPLGYGFGEVLRGTPAGGGAADPRNLFRQLWHGALLSVRLNAAWALSGLWLWIGAASGRLRGGFRGSAHF